MALFTGTFGNDFIVGGDENDLILGLPGNDSLFGGGGNDRIGGGRGDDLIFGGSGNDRISGDGGNDRLAGGFGLDRVFGGTGIDIMSGGRDDDRFIFTQADCVEVDEPQPYAASTDTWPPPPPEPTPFNLATIDLIVDFQGVGTSEGEQDVIDLRRLRDVDFEDIEFIQQGDNTVLVIDCDDHDCGDHGHDRSSGDWDGHDDQEQLVIGVLDTDASQWTESDFLLAA